MSFNIVSSPSDLNIGKTESDISVSLDGNQHVAEQPQGFAVSTPPDQLYNQQQSATKDSHNRLNAMNASEPVNTQPEASKSVEIPNRYRGLLLGRNKSGKFTKYTFNCQRCEQVNKNRVNGRIFTPPTYDWSEFDNRIVNMKMLAEGLWCRLCDEPLSLRHCTLDKRVAGVESRLHVKCTKCGTLRNFTTTPPAASYADLLQSTQDAKVVALHPEVTGNVFMTRTGRVYGRDVKVKKKMGPKPKPKDIKIAAWKGTDDKEWEWLEDQDVNDDSVNEDPQDDDWIMKESYKRTHQDAFRNPNDPEFEIEAAVFPCEYCPESHKSRKQVNDHMRSEHGEAFNNLICGWCGKKSSNENSFRQHRRFHRQGACVCEVCGKQCCDEKRLELHKLDHLPDEEALRFSCSYCGKRFKAEGYLLKHEKIHTAERTFMCDQCPKKFVLKKRLEEHMQLHTGEFQFRCEICSAKFTRMDNMKQHIKNNHKYVCPICHVTCSTGEEVKLHRVQRHTRQEIEASEAEGHAPFYKYTPFQCTHCHRFLASKQSLNFHLATHTGEGRRRPAPPPKVGAPRRPRPEPTQYVQTVLAEPVGERPPILHFQQPPLVPTQLPLVPPQPPVQPPPCAIPPEREETLMATYNLIRVVMDQ